MSSFLVTTTASGVVIFAGRAVVAVAVGALVGLERQWRQRMAGLRTNALVAGGVDADLGSSAKRPMPDGRKSTSRLEPLPPHSLLDGPSGNTAGLSPPVAS
jgi:hypothetical protein